MNHGYCKNCWWWKAHASLHYGNLSKEFKEVWEKINKKPFPTTFGYCYMQNSDLGTFKVTREDCYCPDYINRKKKVCGMKSVDEFIASLD